MDIYVFMGQLWCKKSKLLKFDGDGHFWFWTFFCKFCPKNYVINLAAVYLQKLEDGGISCSAYDQLDQLISL